MYFRFNIVFPELSEDEKFNFVKIIRTIASNNTLIMKIIFMENLKFLNE